MRTLDLKQAAELVKLHPVTLQARAKSGEIPVAKPGKCWVFIEADLLDWLRSHYNQPRQDIGEEGTKCSSNEKIVKIGILNSRSMAEKYTDLLAPITKRPRKR